MKELIFASSNENKVKEIAYKIQGKIAIKGLHDLGHAVEIEETSDTLEGNARIKAWTIFKAYNKNCFADDTGLEVFALNNNPGVRSARYAGEHKNNEDNIGLLLTNLSDVLDRRARFRTVICLIMEGKEFMFEGILNGTIGKERIGTNGFGYDSVFIPEFNSRTLAQMTLDEKNHISHRAIAIEKLNTFLNSELES